MRDPWLQHAAPRRPSTWAEQRRQFRALRVPADAYETLQRWAASPDDLEPVCRLVREIVFSNAVHRAHLKRARWAAGTARDPHYKRLPENPGALRPILALVGRVVADLERLINWEFDPPIELHELGATLKPTRRTVRLSRLDENIRGAFEGARRALLAVRANLREATRRGRGRKATLVQPFRVSAIKSPTEPPTPVRRRQLERMLRDQILRLHPDRGTPPRAARADAGRLARRLIASIL